MRWSQLRNTKANIPPIFSVEGMLNSPKRGSSVTNSVSWKELYTAAMLELDRAALQNRIEAAQTAIQHAMEELAGNHKVGTEEEMHAMADALRNLRALQRVEFRTSTPATSQGQPLAEG
jgi:hypothetical protein